MSLTVTRERKLSDSHVVTPSAPLRQLRRNGGCANVAERRQPSSAGANVAVAPKLPSSSSSLLSWSSSGEKLNFSSVEYQSLILIEESKIVSPLPIGPWTFYPRTLDPSHPRSSGPKSVTPGIGMQRPKNPKLSG